MPEPANGQISAGRADGWDMPRASAGPAILPRDETAAARAVALFLIAGAVFVGSLMAFVPGYGGDTWLANAATVGTAVLIGALGVASWWRPQRMPRVIWVAAPVAATAVICGLDLITDDASAGAQLFFLWPVLYAATFLRGWYIYAVLALVAAAELLVVFSLLPVEVATSDALGLMTALSMASVIIVTLRRRVDRLLATLERQALADPLTGLANRRAFDGELTRAVARALRTGRPVSLLMVDLDHFKTVNDTHGHAAGDQVLGALSDAMRAVSRESDVLARLGGDEFALLLDGELPGARRVADALRQRLAGRTDLPGGPPTVSIGAASLPGHADTVEALLAAADAALYEAKVAGRDRVAVSGTG